MNQSIFQFENYKKYLRSWIKSLPKNGHGELRKISLALGVHTTLVSHVINGNKDFSHEQAYDLTKYLKLTGLETEYFLTLHALEKSGNLRLQEYHLEKLQKIKDESQQIGQRIQSKKTLHDDEKVQFYSEWYFSAIRLMTAIPEYRNPGNIAKKLNLSEEKVLRVLKFLVETGLCTKDGHSYSYGPQSTHIGNDDPLVNIHHKNWRLQSVHHAKKHKDDLQFTMPVILSHKDHKIIKEIILKSIEDITSITDPSECENLSVLNIDWIKLT